MQSMLFVHMHSFINVGSGEAGEMRAMVGFNPAKRVFGSGTWSVAALQPAAHFLHHGWMRFYHHEYHITTITKYTTHLSAGALAIRYRMHLL